MLAARRVAGQGVGRVPSCLLHRGCSWGNWGLVGLGTLVLLTPHIPASEHGPWWV